MTHLLFYRAGLKAINEQLKVTVSVLKGFSLKVTDVSNTFSTEITQQAVILSTVTTEFRI